MILRWIGSLAGAAVLTFATFLTMPALLRVDSPEGGEEFHQLYAIYYPREEREPFLGQLWDHPPCLDCDNHWARPSPSIPVEIQFNSAIQQNDCLLPNIIWNEDDLPDQVSLMVPVVFTQNAPSIYEDGVQISGGSAQAALRFEPYAAVPDFLGIRSHRNHVSPFFPAMPLACDQVYNSRFCLSDGEIRNLITCLLGNQPLAPGHYYFRGTIVGDS